MWGFFSTLMTAVSNALTNNWQGTCDTFPAWLEFYGFLPQTHNQNLLWKILCPTLNHTYPKWFAIN
jgi:hypothetical protein